MPTCLSVLIYEFLLGDEILAAIGFSFADYLETMADELDGIDLSSVGDVADDSSKLQTNAATLRPQGSICRLTSLGGNDRYSADLVENIDGGVRRVKPVRMPDLPNVYDTDPLEQEEPVLVGTQFRRVNLIAV
jgi:hypothetical protein